MTGFTKMNNIGIAQPGKLMQLPLVISIVVMLTNCDPAAGYKFNLHNGTNVDLEVNYSSINITDTTILIGANSTELLDAYSFYGGAYELEQEEFEKYFHRITIFSSDTVIYEEDPAIEDDWDAVRESSWMWSEVTYELLINTRI